MSTLGPLFDLAEARRARDRAVAAVGDHANDAWMAAARQAALDLAATGSEFTTDDIAQRMPGDVTTHEPRALGAVMQRLSREGAIVPVGWRGSSSTVCHGRIKRLWRGAMS